MINTALLPADKDPMGAAIADYFKRHKADRLRVFSSQFDEDEIPVEELFRTEKQMPLLERTALQMATGRILDVGAGSGCHSLAPLQEAGKRGPCHRHFPPAFRGSDEAARCACCVAKPICSMNTLPMNTTLS